MIESIFSLDWNELIFNNSKDFLGIPVVKPPSPSAWSMGSNPGLELRFYVPMATKPVCLH